MPKRPRESSIEDILSEHAERLRAVERALPRLDLDLEEVDVEKFPSYSWQSPHLLATGTGHRLYADRNGRIVFIRAERSAADGTSTAVFDVKQNGTSLFTVQPKPEVAPGEGLGPERRPDTRSFKKGDTFEVEIEDTGGGSGPLRVTIHFVTMT